MPETPYAEYWPDAWRFAFLMTGSAAAAQAAIAQVVPRAAERLIQMRDARQAKRWLFSNLRERCRLAPTLAHPADAPPEPTDRAHEVAELFSHLPEEERCALSLFYLQRFQSDELAEVLDLSALELGKLLGVARQLLGRRPELREGRLHEPAAELRNVPDDAHAGEDAPAVYAGHEVANGAEAVRAKGEPPVALEPGPAADLKPDADEPRPHLPMVPSDAEIG